ncbi:Transcriptional regulator, contains XRE-family HTH domain [Vibrio xiamenensis]|uniref:Transcriptional regulator, contains XRE-family HTH domain n=1 Tax=Vibrio xiamenensis TaxID=861298 RepID=A0A1G7X9B6_9VIBR|nr:2TM domain-containing protein [Vibrio xiamenensis]SDG80733.1 Transcriptional regulator, contains XRE-family HTH domain [Vibrio xiamenensis]
MLIRKLRLERGWSQDQLATLSGLSVRTIQRIERGATPGLESLNALAAVFEVDIEQLKHGESSSSWSLEEQQVYEQVKEIKGFYSHLISYVAVIAMLFVINLIVSPGYIWAIWPMLGWGIGLTIHGLNTFEVMNLFGADWERKQVEKRLADKNSRQ